MAQPNDLSAQLADIVAERLSRVFTKDGSAVEIEYGVPEVHYFEDVGFHDFVMRGSGVTLAFLMEKDRTVWIHDVERRTAVSLTAETDLDALIGQLSLRLLDG